VSGNAILHALASDLSFREQREVSVSHGIFVPGEYGVYPDEHSQTGGHPNFGHVLPEPET